MGAQCIGIVGWPLDSLYPSTYRIDIKQDGGNVRLIYIPARHAVAAAQDLPKSSLRLLLLLLAVPSFIIVLTPWALNINQFRADICATNTLPVATVKRECNS